MISTPGEQVRSQIRHAVGPMLRSLLNFPIEQRRSQLEAIMSQVQLPSGIEIEETRIGGVPCEWVRPAGGAQSANAGVFLYLHAGWCTMGSPRTDRSLTAALALMSGRSVLSVEYRLAPEYPFPAPLDDTLAVYRALISTGTAPKSILFAGSSVGGGLSVAAFVALRDAGDPLPAGAVLLSSVTDWAASGASHVSKVESDMIDSPAVVTEMRACYLGERDPRNPLASPIYADLRGLPPLLIQVGGDEILLDDSTVLAERAQAAGVPVTLYIGEGMWHNWHMIAASTPFPEGQVALDQIRDFAAQFSANAVS
ncbi:MAG TPA: alpha/beta hydrolase [Ktedonobacteraceae bacterium]